MEYGKLTYSAKQTLLCAKRVAVRRIEAQSLQDSGKYVEWEDLIDAYLLTSRLAGEMQDAGFTLSPWAQGIELEAEWEISPSEAEAMKGVSWSLAGKNIDHYLKRLGSSYATAEEVLVLMAKWSHDMMDNNTETLRSSGIEKSPSSRILFLGQCETEQQVAYLEELLQRYSLGEVSSWELNPHIIDELPTVREKTEMGLFNLNKLETAVICRLHRLGSWHDEFVTYGEIGAWLDISKEAVRDVVEAATKVIANDLMSNVRAGAKITFP